MGRSRRTGLRTMVAVLVTLVATTAAPALTSSAAAQSVPPSYNLSLVPHQFTFSPGAGGLVGEAAELWSTGAASAFVTTTHRVRTLTFVLDADQCEGSPRLEVVADGRLTLSQEIDGRGAYGVLLDWPPGRHKITFRFLNDHRTSWCDRNIRFQSTWLRGTMSQQVPIWTMTWLKPEYVTVAPAGAGKVTSSRATLWTNGTMRFRLDSLYSNWLVLAVSVVGCEGRPLVTVDLDGRTVYRGEGRREITVLPEENFTDGAHEITLTMSQDLDTATCDPSLSLTGAQFRINDDGSYQGPVLPGIAAADPRPASD